MSNSLRAFAARAVIVAGVAFMAPATIWAARTITVPSGKIKTINQAMAKASNGDTVIVELESPGDAAGAAMRLVGMRGVREVSVDTAPPRARARSRWSNRGSSPSRDSPSR